MDTSDTSIAALDSRSAMSVRRNSSSNSSRTTDRFAVLLKATRPQFLQWPSRTFQVSLCALWEEDLRHRYRHHLQLTMANTRMLGRFSRESTEHREEVSQSAFSSISMRAQLTPNRIRPTDPSRAHCSSGNSSSLSRRLAFWRCTRI